MSSSGSDLEHGRYAASHPVLPLSAKRFSPSPFLDYYVTPETIFGAYSGRLYPLTLGEEPVEAYWHLRRKAALFDVPEHPVDITGPDAERLLDRLLTRDVSKLATGRAAYALACYPDGGIMMDGVILKLSEDHFRYVLADGEFLGWLLAHGEGMDVSIDDPGSWVLQVQGPTSLDIFALACDAPVPRFRYFDVVEVEMGGQRVLASRTGWSGELGFELYTEPGLDSQSLWRHLLDAGTRHGLDVQGLESLGTRRIEAGILDNGTDMDPSMTPYQAGLGRFVDLGKPTEFVGRTALTHADRTRLLVGFASTDMPSAGDRVFVDDEPVGQVTISTWSPLLDRAIGYVRMSRAGDWTDKRLAIGDGGLLGEITALPFYDGERQIARGLATAPDTGPTRTA